MEKNRISKKETLFYTDCKLVYIPGEYGEEYNGDAKWMIFTDLTEDELVTTYQKEILYYSPYILMRLELYYPILESNNNERKQRWRMGKMHDLFDYVDGEMEYFHPELVQTPDERDFSDLYEALNQLTFQQRQRIWQHYFIGMSNVEIAAVEGISPQSISQSNRIAIKKLRRKMKGE